MYVTDILNFLLKYVKFISSTRSDPRAHAFRLGRLESWIKSAAKIIEWPVSPDLK